MSDSNKDNKSNLPKLKFNSYWIYGAIIITIIAVQFFSSGDLASKSISKNKFDEILKDNDIKEIVVLNKDIAQIFLTQDALKKATHKKIYFFNFLQTWLCRL
jgi:cell division protease FtsH